ncbi:MAG TPA: DUF4870 domain-containing protein [Verrucomicrobiota bacterium]|nr:DUF4870 domain-containing protein [Verrucomicrobiota bacterium]
MNEQPAQPPAPTGPTPSQPPTESDIRMWNMWCHLSALAGLVGVPFGNVLGPLIVWQIKKDQIPSVVEHGKAALNFQITVLLAVIVTVIAAIVLSLILIGFLLIPVAIVIGICGAVFAVVAGIKANEGKDYRYPYSITFIK